jgi:hypothetical protein
MLGAQFRPEEFLNLALRFHETNLHRRNFAEAFGAVEAKAILSRQGSFFSGGGAEGKGT